MAALLRSCSPALAAAIAGGVTLLSADCYTFTLVDGLTKYYLTNWKNDLSFGGQNFVSSAPWISRSKWSVVNTMEVATMEVKLAAYNTAWQSGRQIKLQMHNGLFDGASCVLNRVFMLTPGDTTTLGGVQLFGGDVGAIDIMGLESVMKIKAKINRLDMQTPRNFFGIPCLHGFCDAGCTLSRATYTTSHTVGAGTPTIFFIPWDVVPADPTVFINGTIAFLGGANSGARRNIVASDNTGVTVVYPLNYLPVTGDSCTLFQGCDKSFNNAGSTQSCTSYANTQHYRGFEFVPPPLSAY